VKALGDPAVGYVVEDKLLPALGHLVVPELHATLRIEKGKEIDAKKLRVLAEIEKDALKPLLVEATGKGSPEIKRTAIEILGERDPAAAEPIALRLLEETKAQEVRRAALGALGGATGDATLDALFKVFTDHRELRHQAGLSLARLTHPKTTERALSLLTKDLLELGNLKLPKADTKSKKEANEKLEKAHREKVDFLASVLDLLASRSDKLQTAETVLGVFHNHKVKEARNAAALALLKSGYSKAFDELAPSVYEADWETQDGFVEGILQQDPDHAFERLGRFLDPVTFKGKNHVAFANRVLGSLEGQGDSGEEPTEDEEEADDKPEVRPPSILQKDPRWAEAAIKLLDHKDLSDNAIDVLGNIKSDRAKEAVIAHAAAQKKSDQGWRILRILATYRDARVPPLMMRYLDLMQGSWARRWVFRTLREYDDPTVVPALKSWLEAKKKKLDKRDKEELEETLRLLERDRNVS
jgi:hypothetical protein